MVGVIDPNLQERLDQLHLLAPVDPEAYTRWRPAPRLENLHGKVGGFLGNRKHNAEQLLRDVRELLDKRYELMDTVTIDKFVYSRPAAPDIVNAMSERCDFVITAIAD
jgi:hypothetical protein